MLDTSRMLQRICLPFQVVVSACPDPLPEDLLPLLLHSLAEEAEGGPTAACLADWPHSLSEAAGGRGLRGCPVLHSPLQLQHAARREEGR